MNGTSISVESAAYSRPVNTETMSRINTEIEALRAIAITMTMVAHFNGFLFPGGVFWMRGVDAYFFFGVGVDLFFCISGYVVSKSFIDKLDRCKEEGNHWNAAFAFWTRRMFRLLPSSWFWVAFTLACSTLYEKGTFGTIDENIRSALVVLFFCGNLILPVSSGLGPNVVHWSLALEEQFYFSLPFLLIFISSQWRFRVFLVVAVCMFFLDRTGGTFLWFTRFDGFIWGVLIYMLSKFRAYQDIRRWLPRKPLGNYIFMPTILLLMAALPPQKLMVGYGLIFVLCAVLVLSSSYEEGIIFIDKYPIVQWIGSRSYAIYLAHIPAFRITDLFFQILQARIVGLPKGPLSIVIVLTGLALTCAFSEISFRLLERPFREIGKRLASKFYSSKRRIPAAFN